jgi:D-2-hydroxyacid dehydrogenase (NADP+)
MTTVLVLEKFADVYVGPLRERFPGLNVQSARALSEVAIDPSEIDVLVAFGIAINDDFVKKATNLQWVQSLASGVDHFLRSPWLRPQTLLTSTRGIHGPAMRESVAYLMLSANRDTARLVRNQANHAWDRSRPWPLLAGKATVVVGIGVGGIAVGQLLHGFGMRVLGISRVPRPIEGFDAILPRARLIEAVREVDYVVNILPGGPENAGLISRAVFEAMKPSAYFINVGRGDTLDETALIDSLRARRIAGAGLDVFCTEPLPADSPLWDLPNVFICPHLGGLFKEYEEYVMPILLENMELFLQGRGSEMRNLVQRG